jgi:hypothetical protein
MLIIVLVFISLLFSQLRKADMVSRWDGWNKYSSKRFNQKKEFRIIPGHQLFLCPNISPAAVFRLPSRKTTTQFDVAQA